MTRTILFVCFGNSGRSQMAEAFFNKLSKDWRAVSAGTNPDKKMHPLTLMVMREIGIDVSKQKPKKVRLKMMEEADKIVVMGVGTDFIPEKYLHEVEKWEIEEPYRRPIVKIREIRNQIKEKVEELIHKLEH